MYYQDVLNHVIDNSIDTADLWFREPELKRIILILEKCRYHSPKELKEKLDTALDNARNNFVADLPQDWGTPSVLEWVCKTVAAWQSLTGKSPITVFDEDAVLLIERILNEDFEQTHLKKNGQKRTG